MTDRMALDQKPLYAQVRELLRERIRSGALRPGTALPNEFALARELGVSQGTVRKALDALAAEKLLVRSPGRTGTRGEWGCGGRRFGAPR